jgi:hypothetical protein
MRPSEVAALVISGCDLPEEGRGRLSFADASPLAEVAAWAGHSVEMLTRVYVHCVTGMEDVWISRMDQALNREDGDRHGGDMGEESVIRRHRMAERVMPRRPGFLHRTRSRPEYSWLWKAPPAGFEPALPATEAEAI